MTDTAPLPRMMGAVRWHGPRDVRYEQVPVPIPTSSEVLIRVERTGLCGSDLEEFREGPVAITPGHGPIILGHEVVGTVAVTADGGPPVGTRVVPDVVVGCGHCWWCRRHEEGLCPTLRVRGQQQDGGLADYMLADAATCVPVPIGLALDVAAFAEPVAVAVRAVRKAGDLTGTTVAVIGGGTIGNLIGQVAVAGPSREVVIIDPIPARRDLAAQIGVTPAAIDDADEIVRSLSGGRGADVIFECSGAQHAPAKAVQLSRRGGTIVLVGFRPGELAVPWLDVVLHERHLVGTAAHLWDEDVAAAVALLARGVLDPSPLHSGTIPLESAPQAFRDLDENPALTKLLISPAVDAPTRHDGDGTGKEAHR